MPSYLYSENEPQMLLNPGDPGEGAPAGGAGALHALGGDEREELQRLRIREREIAELLGCSSPDRLLHDLRNVLNELQLLRMLNDDKI